MVNVVEFAIQFKIVANNNNIRECCIHARKNNKPHITYKTFHTNNIYFIFKRSFILHIGIVKINLTNANIHQIIVTHHALPTISLIYIEKYVSVHNHRHIIKSANDKEIHLIFTGIKFFVFDNVFLIFFSIVPLF